MDLSAYRKLVATLVTATAMMVLRYMGMDPADLGLDVPLVADGVAEWVLQVGVPAVALWAFPQDTDGVETTDERARRNQKLMMFVGGVVVLVVGLGVVGYYL